MAYKYYGMNVDFELSRVDCYMLEGAYELT